MLVVHPDRNHKQAKDPADFLTKLINNSHDACKRHFSNAQKMPIVISDDDCDEMEEFNADEGEFSP